MEIAPHTQFTYLLEASICLAVFYMFYIVVLRKQPAFAYNRAYLLISSLLALILPLLEVPVWNSATSSEFSGVSPDFSVMILPDVAVGEGSKTAQTVSWQQILWWSYTAGALLMLARLFWQIYSIRKVIRQERLTVSKKGYWIVHTNGQLPIASYFNYLLWDNRAQISEADKQRIIAHEEAHMAQGHSYDVLYMSLIKILLWFNPFAYFYFKELTDVHEYAADARVLTVTDAKAYAKILVNQLFQDVEYSMLNHFYKSQTLKRLKMMKRTKNKINRYRMLWALPVFALMFFIFSCQEEDTLAQADASLESYESIQAEIQKVRMELEAITQQYPNYKLHFKTTAASPLVEVGGADDYLNAIEGVNNGKDKKTIANLHYQLLRLEEKLLDPAMPDAEGRYFVVEEQPSPEGGMKAFYEHVSKNLKYPAAARQQGIGGRAFVQFVVDTDGSITEVETLKVQGEGVGFDEEAERVVRSAPAWNPGRQDGKAVKVKMILPITFVLDGGDNTASESKIVEEPANPKMSEIVVVAYASTGK